MGAELVTGAREEVLRRIRAALGDVPQADEAAIRGEWETLPRNYKRAGSLECDALLELLEDRLRDYDASVVRAEAGKVGAEIGRILAERGKRRLVVPIGLAEAIGESLPGGFEFVTDDGLAVMELDGFDGVVTASSVAIAETGTIVLQHVPGTGKACADADSGLPPVRGAGWGCRGDGAGGDGAFGGDGVAGNHICIRAFGDSGYRDDPHQRSAWAAISGRNPGSVGRNFCI